MGKEKVKNDNVSGFRIAVMIISILLLSFIMAFSMLLGISSFKRNGPVVLGEDATTVRKALPAAGTFPTASTPIDNIGYMAYVLDRQPAYHAYAYNSTKSTGYEQVTQTWKDYKSAELSGEDISVMVCTDLSYSALIKSATQSCFIGDNEAHVRSGNKPGKNSLPSDVEWSKNAPSVYDKKGYKYAYGEFSTEISVYVINEQTLSGADEVIDNGDGTYSQKYYLNENAACWYQYKMKTNGGLKIFPRFKKIEITFTFDDKWQILESYCEERATINPRALGGMDMESNSKTTTTFDYSAEGFDNDHYAYFDSYFKKYQGTDPGENETPEITYGVLDILGGGFSKVVGGGQQFSLDLTLGNTKYDGKVFLSLPDMGDVLGTLDVRVALEKRGSGRQDLYIEFKNGAVNVYYGTGFALTADIDGMSQSVTKIADWIKNITKPARPVALYAADGRDGGLDISSLLNDLKLEITDTEAFISLKSENLLNLGIGVDVVMGFDRIKEEGGDAFSAKSIDLNYVKLDGKEVGLKANIVPEEGEAIKREPVNTPANLADYAESVYKLLSSKTIKVDLSLADKLIDGLTLDAAAYVAIGSDIAARAEISALYKGISLKLDADYVYGKTGYGRVYLHVREINGREVNARVYCDIEDAVSTVKDIISLFRGNGGGSGAPDEGAKTELAEIINKVLNLDFENIIGKVKGDSESISLGLNVDALLSGLGVNAGLNFGELELTLDREPARLSGSLPALGLGVAIYGSENVFPETDKENFVDINAYLESVYSILSKPSYDISVSLVGAKLTDKIDLSGLKVNGVATAAIENGTVRVSLPVTARYGDFEIKLNAYYTINLSEGSYGTVYLSINEIAVGEKTITLDARAYCDIKNVVNGIKDLIAKFTPKTDAPEATVPAGEQAGILAKAVETLLKLDYNEIINATNEGLSVKLNVDEILSGLEISLGGISFGELNLEFEVATGALSGKLENLGLTVGVSGNDDPLAEFATEGYVDLGAYLDSISALIGKASYNLELSFAGNGSVSDKLDLTGLKLDLNAQIAFAEDFRGVTVDINNLAVSYKEISIELSAHYQVSFNGSYGTVYLFVDKINGTAVEAKASLDITDAVNGVKDIINAFRAPAAQGYAEGSTNVVANIINGVLKLDFNELLSVTAEKAELKLDLDKLLSEFNLGLNLGTVELEYLPADFTLTGSDKAIGLNLFRLTGSDDALDEFIPDGYIDLNAFIDGVKELVNSSVYEIGLNFRGKEIGGIDLSGLELDATAYATVENGYNNITVYLPVRVSYCGLAVELNAYYSADINGKDFSTVYFELTKIDDTALSAKVYCDVREVITAVKEIINAFKPEADNGGVSAQAASADIISKVIGIVLNLDYPDMIKGTKDKLSVTVDVDEILSGLEISLGGISFGELKLDLTLADGRASLCGRLDTLGVEASLKGNGSYEMPAAPDKGDYLDLTSALKLVKALIDEGKRIEAARDVAFSISGTATLGGVPAAVNGSGEVIWGDTVRVAVALSLAIDGKTLDINVVYDAASDPFLILTLNKDGVKISRSETDNLVKSFKELIEAFKKAPAEGVPDTYGIAAQATEVGGVSLEEILKNAGVKKVLNAVLGFINDFSVEITENPEDVFRLVIKHLGGARITLGADGCLSLEIANAQNGLTATAEAGNGATVNAILGDLNGEGNYSYFGLSEFVKKLYLGLFDGLEGVSLSEVLGNPFTASLSLSGKNSGISALEGVSVKADLYYDEGVAGTAFETKLMHAALNLDINGTPVSASASYHGRTVFIDLRQIGGTKLTGIRFRTDVENIFDAAEEIVRLVTDTTLVQTVNKLTGKGTLSTDEIENLEVFAQQSENGTPASDTLTKLLNAILNLDLENSFKLDRETNTLTVNVDALTEAMLGVKIGTVTATYTDNSTEGKVAKAVTADIRLDGGEPWLTLDARTSDERDAGIINPDDYMDIGFISTLLSDLVETVTDGENLVGGKKPVYDLFTFAGNITVNASVSVINISLEFKNATITAGFDSDNKFYLTLAASMQEKKVLGMTVTANRDISITYSEGLIVLGRDIGTGSERYKVITLEYLLDNLMDKTNSPIRWLLGTSEDVWKILADNVNLNIDSGLTKPKTYTLYEQLQQTDKEGKFNLSDYLSGLSVRTDGGEPTVYGNNAALAVNKFGLTDNYYALDVNAKKLTGGTLTGLCAVITRDAGGLNGIKAYGEIGSMVNFTLDFDKYLEGVTEVYGGKVFELIEANGVTAEKFDNDFKEAEGVTADSFTEQTYYEYDADSDTLVKAEEFVEGTHYFVAFNNRYYVKNAEGKAELATSFIEGAQYFEYIEKDSSAGLGSVAVRNYLDYVTKTYGFDRNKKFVATDGHISNHTTPIFGCYNSEDNSYITSDVLETVYLDVYDGRSGQKLERTLEVLYGSTVKLVRDFPEFADGSNDKKLIYENIDGENLYNSIVVTESELARKGLKIVDGRVSIYKHSVAAVEVTLSFVGVGNMESQRAAFVVGDELNEYPLNGYTFLGWYREESLTNSISVITQGDVTDGRLTVYGKYVKSLYEASNGVSYTFDAGLDGGRGGYFVSGVNENIVKYYGNSNEWLEIESEINGIYKVWYIGEKAFANSENDKAHSLVNVLVPETVTAVYEKAFLDNKGLKSVVFLADAVFFAGSMNNTVKNAVFYGCYPEANPSDNNDCTVYYNKTLKRDPNNSGVTIDDEWYRIYFDRAWYGAQTIYRLKTRSGGWAFAEFEANVPEGVDLSGIISNGLQFTAYGEAGNLATAINNKLTPAEGYYFEVTASGALPLDCKRHYITITVTENENVAVTETDIAVTVKFGGSVLYSETLTVAIDAALDAVYDGLEFAGKNDYVFLGWYINEDLTVSVPTTVNKGNVTKLYAKLMERTITLENGVRYEFVEGTEQVVAHYVVSGFDTDKGGKYTGNDEWLIIANTVNGYNVTEIKANAFKGTGIKNVVVPSNITKVGTMAFADNVDMLNAVFLAGSVHFDGSVTNGMQSSTYAFAGCCITGNSQWTNLTVYYTQITDNGGDKDGNPGWSWFGTGGRNKPRYIGGNDGGKRVDGGWTFAVFASAEYGYKTGVYEADKVTKDSIIATVVTGLNKESYKDGFIYGHVVAPEIKVENGGVSYITVSVSESSDTGWHLLSFDGTLYNINDGEGEDDGILFYENGYFVKPDASVELSLKDGTKVFTGVIVNGEEIPLQNVQKYSFNMGNVKTEISFNAVDKPIDRIKLISSVEFTSNVSLDANGYYTLPENTTVALSSITAVNGEYTLIGWAYEDGARLSFEETVKHTEYYAIWMKSRSEITGASVNYDDGEVTANAAGSVYGWYTSSSFTGNPVAACTDNAAILPLTKESTVFHARMQYNFVLDLQAGSTNFGYTKLNTDKAANVNDNTSYTDLSADKGNVTNSFVNQITSGSFTFEPVPEGYSITAYRFWSDAFVLTVKNGNSDSSKTVVTYLIKGRNTKGSWGQYSWRPIGDGVSHYVEFISGGWTLGSKLQQGAEANQYWLGKTSDQDEFGFISKVNTDIKIKLAV